MATAAAAYSQEQLDDIRTRQKVNQVNGDVIDATTQRRNDADDAQLNGTTAHQENKKTSLLRLAS